MHAHSINVYIAARDDDEAIDEYEDEHTERKLRKVAMSSRLIAVRPGSLFGIHIKFGNDFDLHGADGVAVLTAWDEFEWPLPHCRQLFWIEKADMATETVIENAMSFSKNARSEIWPLQMSRRSGIVYEMLREMQDKEATLISTRRQECTQSHHFMGTRVRHELRLHHRLHPTRHAFESNRAHVPPSDQRTYLGAVSVWNRSGVARYKAKKPMSQVPKYGIAKSASTRLVHSLG